MNRSSPSDTLANTGYPWYLISQSVKSFSLGGSAEVRLYDRLFVARDPDEAPPGKNFLANLNPDSLVVKKGCRVEPALAASKPGEVFQLERLGYFHVDPDTAPGRPVFNRSVSLRDTWAKIEKKSREGA